MIGAAPTFTPWRAVTFALPIASIIVAIMMMPLPFAIKLGSYWLMPSLPLITIFLWTTWRPDLLPPVTLLIAGLLMDFLIDGPIGASSLAFLTAYSITASQRVYWISAPEGGMLVGFGLVLLVCGIVTWLANSFAHGELLNPMPVVLEAIVSVMVFPLARRMLSPLHRLAGPAV